MYRHISHPLSIVFMLILTGCTPSGKREEKPGNPDDTNTQTKNELFIDFVFQFEDTGELYVPLFFRDDFDYEAYDQVANSADSVIAKNDEITRKRIPLNIAKGYFDLSSLEQIRIYDEQANETGSAQLIRIEYMEGLIEAEFIAVFKPSGPVTDYLYCIANLPDEKVKGIQYSSETNDRLRDHLMSSLQLDEETLWNMDHFQFPSQNKYLTVLSADTISYILDGKENPKQLYKSKEAEIINQAVPVALERNGYPVLLISSARPETDMFWSYVLVFDGKSYAASKNNRLPLD